MKLGDTRKINCEGCKHEATSCGDKHGKAATLLSENRAVNVDAIQDAEAAEAAEAAWAAAEAAARAEAAWAAAAAAAADRIVDGVLDALEAAISKAEAVG